MASVIHEFKSCMDMAGGRIGQKHHLLSLSARISRNVFKNRFRNHNSRKGGNESKMTPHFRTKREIFSTHFFFWRAYFPFFFFLYVTLERQSGIFFFITLAMEGRHIYLISTACVVVSWCCVFYFLFLFSFHHHCSLLPTFF